MAEACVLERNCSAKSSAAVVHAPTVPLTFMHTGQRAQVVKVRGHNDLHHHLETLGFVENAEIGVVSEQGGNLIVEVKGAHVALDASAARNIIMRLN